MGNVKVWDGSSWVEVNNIQTENGGLQDITAVKRWDGSQWVTVGSPETVVENFESGDLSSYSLDTGEFSVQTGTVFDGTYALESDSDGTVGRIVDSSKTVSAGNTYKVAIQLAEVDSYMGVVFGVQDDSSLDGYMVLLTGATSNYTIFRVDNGSFTKLTRTNFSYTQDIWYQTEFKWETDGSLTATLFDDTDTQQAQLTATDSNYSSGGLGFREANGTAYADYVREI
jgi:hypothetical protein